MKPRATLSVQLRALLSTLLWVWFPSAFVLVVAVVVSSSSGIVRLRDLLRDPTAISGNPFYLGLISNLGVLLWAATAAICLFSYTVLRRYGRNSELAPFLLWTGLGTTLFCLSDFFLLHEEVLPNYFGISEKIVFSVYGLLGILYLIRFTTLILKTEYLILVIAFIFLWLSVVFDQFPPQLGQSTDFSYFLEDAPKLIGISTCLMYFCRVSALAFQQEFSKVRHKA